MEKGWGRREKGSLEKLGEPPPRYLPRSVKFLKAPPSRAILTLIVNLEEHLRKDGEPGCRGAGGGEGWRGRKGRARERQGETQRGEWWGREAMEQNLRPGRPARAALLLSKTIFQMFKLCSRVPEQNPEQAGGQRRQGVGTRRLRAPLCSRPGAQRFSAARGRCAGLAWPRGRRGPPGVPGRQGPRKQLSGVFGACSLASSLPPHDSRPVSLLRACSPRFPQISGRGGRGVFRVTRRAAQEGAEEPG